ncbi:YVTN repeat-like/Quino protein amine dehydrogenase [Setomelanomma holmii]|uniref:YVTN repeat-like/Quino protein amine dehydrogenase n=1 Tax=Setomelanomma holmii TaxID=210430 RepID=A0A9P4HFL3_9PLEO|nr:YVTN repeat-like/Quino protein amine dehydrogenase [Setomelanomma holmii]
MSDQTIVDDNCLPCVTIKDLDVSSVAFSPDGQLVAMHTAGFFNKTGTVKLFDTATGLLKAHDVNSDAFAFSPDGQLMALACRPDKICLYETATGLCRTILPVKEHLSDLYAHIAFSSDGQLLAAVSYKTSIQLWDVNNGAYRSTPRNLEHEFEVIGFSPSGRTALTNKSRRYSPVHAVLSRIIFAG